MAFDSVPKLWRRKQAPPVRSYSFSRPLVLLQSDDWGRVGARDREGYEPLRASGIRLGGTSLRLLHPERKRGAPGSAHRRVRDSQPSSDN
jgi:hypothetical protein